MKQLFDDISLQCSRSITRKYSTSFSMGIRCLAADQRDPIYSIYGFVRLADEIVDSFHGYDQQGMLEEFKRDTFRAIQNKISVNPVLNCFQKVVHDYKIDPELISAFLFSMGMDLEKQQYTEELYEKYIYGSAEVVGLMCLRVFCKGDDALFDSLKEPAMKLGAAFQKINFLRDIQSDFEGLGRTYFPDVDFTNFCETQKKDIEADIEEDFEQGFEGIKRLPKHARFGVFLAYVYYKMLFRKIQALPCDRIMTERISIPNSRKFTLLLSSYVRNNLNMIR